MAAFIARDAPVLEAVHGDLDQAKRLFVECIEALHQSGDTINVKVALGNLEDFFDRTEQPRVAATLFGATALHPVTNQRANIDAAVDHLRSVLDATTFGRSNSPANTNP